MNGPIPDDSLLVLGGGIGGYTAAIRAAREGMSVTLVEPGELGGTCLNVGCIPTKSLLHQAHQFRQVHSMQAFGIDPLKLRLDFAAVGAKKNQVVQQLVQGVRSLVKRNRITLVKGHAEFIEPNTVLLQETGERLRAAHFVVATGSVPVMPPLLDMELPAVVTSDGALKLERLPHRVLVMGGGAVGVEFAQIFRDFGSEVILVEQQEALLSQEDSEVVAVLHQHLEKRGVAMRLGRRVQLLRAAGAVPKTSIQVELTGSDSPEQLEVDLVLVAVGRQPRVEGLGLDRLGIRMNKGAIATDDVGRTSLPHIYAVGDVRGGLMLAHKASAEAEVAVAHMLFQGKARSGFQLNHQGPLSMAALVIPRAVYTSPEIAAVGLTEEQARTAHLKVKVGRFLFSANGRALSMGESEGLVKVVADAATDRVLGISMVGPSVTNLLGEATLAVQMELTLKALAQTVHPHPTLTEALAEAAHDADGNAIHIPPSAKKNFKETR
jgi:dihydrolipoamide dehydrogenase